MEEIRGWLRELYGVRAAWRGCVDFVRSSVSITNTLGQQNESARNPAVLSQRQFKSFGFTLTPDAFHRIHANSPCRMTMGLTR